VARLLVRVSVAAFPAAGAAWLVVTALARLGLELTSKLDAVGALAVAGVVGVAVFTMLAALLHIEEVTQIRRALLGRMRPERQPQR
jgi:hypothetical protein